MRTKTAWTIVLALAATTVAQSALPTTRPATRSAQDILGQMLRPTTQSAPPLKPIAGASGNVDITSGQGTVPGGATTQATMREGIFLIDRAGRMTRSADSKEIQFTFDADNRNMTDPPVILLPNLNLMKMEAAIGGSNRDMRFRITGEVTEYNGRNYVLLQKVTAIPEVFQPLK